MTVGMNAELEFCPDHNEYWNLMGFAVLQIVLKSYELHLSLNIELYGPFIETL